MESWKRETIKIWGDNWLLSISSPQALGPLSLQFQEATVSTLINPITRSRDINLLTFALSPTDADQVQRIPLSRREANDVLFWPFVQSGEYTVKSGYFFLKTESKNGSNEVGSSSEHTKPVWKQIWKLDVLSKVKNFLWRACRNALPTNANLVQRCVMTDSRCCVCDSHDENVLLCLWSCPS